MFRKLSVAGAVVLGVFALTISVARAQQFAPIPTSPTSTVVTAPPQVATTTTAPVTTVERSTDEFANTGPREWIGAISFAGLVLFALGFTLRGKRAPGQFFFDRR